MSEFQTTKQIYQALIDGVKLTSDTFPPEWSYAHLDKNGNLVNQDGVEVNYLFGHPYMWRTYKEPSWKDNLDGETPVLCWVSDFTEIPNNTCFSSIIRGYDTESEKFVSKNSTSWEHATPMSEEEIMQFLANRKKVMSGCDGKTK